MISIRDCAPALVCHAGLPAGSLARKHSTSIISPALPDASPEPPTAPGSSPPSGMNRSAPSQPLLRWPVGLPLLMDSAGMSTVPVAAVPATAATACTAYQPGACTVYRVGFPDAHPL